MSLSFERLYPWLFGAMSAVLSWLLDGRLPGDPNYSAVLSAAISVAAILVGFLATMKSILMAVPTVVQRLRDSGYMSDLVSYLSTSITTNLLLCALSLSGFFPWATVSPGLFAIIWFGCSTIALLSFWRVTRIMTMLLYQV